MNASGGIGKALVLAIIGVGAAASVAPATAAAATLSGAGSTLIAPLEQQWGSGFASANPGDSVTYGGVGSGTGVQYVAKNLVAFGATDAPVTSVGGVSCSHCELVPWALTATGIGYNISGVGEGLKLTGRILAEIYLGKITNWHNSQITKINPGLHLPKLKITPLFRSDTSGDSYAFTGYLGAVNSTWAKKKGGATVSFPASIGTAENGNGGVAGEIKAVSGAIGYVSASYLVTQKITVARIQNAAGNYEYPNLSNIEDAASGIKTVPADNALHIVDPPKTYARAYPISTFSYALVHRSGNANVSLLRKWLTYCVTTGRSDGVSLDFAPIPKVVQTAALKAIASIS